MLPLTLLIHLFLGATLAGVAIVAALLLGAASALPLAAAGLIGFLAAFPVSRAIAKRLHGPRP